MDYLSSKHVEQLNVMNKINHQILCILLDYGDTGIFSFCRNVLQETKPVVKIRGSRKFF